MLIDRNHKVVYVNNSLCLHRKLPREKLIGQSCYMANHHCSEPCWKLSNTIKYCPVDKAFKTQTRAHAIHKHVINDRVIVEEIIVTPLCEGKYVMEELRDISQMLGLVDGVLSICSSCKRIHDAEGNWDQVEGYIHDCTGADFTHGICPECLRKLYPELAAKIEMEDEE